MATTTELTDDFPYKRTTGNMLADIERRIRALMLWRPSIIIGTYEISGGFLTRRDLELRVPNGRQPECTRMAFQGEDYEKYNLISDYFIEQHRIRALHGARTTESVFDYWCAHKAEILQQAAADKKRPREVVYYATTEVGTFRPTVMVGLLWFLRANFRRTWNYVLDPCAGWGDRMIGAIAADARGYVSADPNAALAPEYVRIHAWARAIVPRCAAVRHFVSPFEDIPVGVLLKSLAEVRRDNYCGGMPDETVVSRTQIAPEDGYDLAMTSPPYFTLEIYDREDRAGTQSTTRYPTWREWYQQFLITMMRNAAACLRVGGILGIVISMKTRQSFDQMLLDMRRPIQSAAGRTCCMEYLGALAFTKFDATNEHEGHVYVPSPQPIFLWIRKT